jgi:molybdopterin-binding protein
MGAEGFRIGQAAEALGVRVETLRRWESQGKLRTERTGGGQRLVPAEELSRLLAERRAKDASGPATSLRNRFPGIVVRIQKDKVAATVEIMAGPHRILSLLTREAVDELGLQPGSEVVANVKATNVSVDVPRR